jgi:hypothetical protein
MDAGTISALTAVLHRAAGPPMLFSNFRLIKGEV